MQPRKQAEDDDAGCWYFWQHSCGHGSPWPPDKARTEAARLLGVSPRSLRYLLQKHTTPRTTIDSVTK
ncbi:MAG: hypothetical protein IH859_02355, partial [Chloroflexi bacterium]|nr:hypothetical protein [Chloroflexota bacterium]